jgi:hypothetical protein
MSAIYRRNRTLRAVSVVIGVMLMLSILFLTAAQYQLVRVPLQEEQAEVEHHRLISSQMGEVQAGILAASSNSAPSAQKLNVGTRYSQDLIFGIVPEVHQPDPSGRISNEEFSERIKVKNAEGLGSARNYWPGDLDGSECQDPNHCYSTTSFHYEADYNQYRDNPEIVYENTVAYDHYDTNSNDEYDETDDYQFHSEQNLVQGRNINLIALTGNLNQARSGPTTLRTIPVSAPAQTITIESDTETAGDPVQFRVPTRVPADIWRTELLAKQMSVDPNTGESNERGKVQSVQDVPGENAVSITMVEGEVYNLKLSRVHLTTREEQSTIPTEKAAYVAWKGSERVTIRENSTNEILAQARDRYNNAVPGVRTKSIAEDADNNCIGSFRSQHPNTGECPDNQQPGEQTSGEDGSLAYSYIAPDVDSDTAITIQLLLDDPDNTVGNNGKKTTPELLASQQPVSAFFPNPSVGHINEDNTLRITDVSYQDTSTTAKSEVITNVTLDNTGTETIDRTIAITGTGDLSASPQELTVDLDPGEREKHTTRLRLNNSGIQTVQFGSYTTSIKVTPPSTGIVPGVIDNRRNLETNAKSPGRFKDGDPINEFKETQNIPPVQFDPQAGEYKDTAEGNLIRLSQIDVTDDENAQLDGNTSKTAPNSLNVGLATDRVANNDYYTLFFDYSFANSASNVSYNIVNSGGDPIDQNSNYLLKNEQTTAIKGYQLTDEEAQYLRSTQTLYTVIDSTETTTVPQLRLDRMWLVSSDDPLSLTSPKTSVDPETIETSATSVRTGKPLRVEATIANDGSEAVKKQLSLFRTENGDTIVTDTKTVYVNPDTTRTVGFTHYETNPGQYQFSIGSGVTPETNGATVDITHR